MDNLQQFIVKSKSYQRVLAHRKICLDWPASPEQIVFGTNLCMQCFGGGLTRFSENIIKEFVSQQLKDYRDIHFSHETFVKAANKYNKKSETTT